MTGVEVAIQKVITAIEAIKDGGMVIMVDDEDRENEGDLVFAAEHVCPEKINFMTKEARGLICLALDQKIINRLKLPMMADTTKAGSSRSTAFTVSIEAREGVTTGISAADRAHTVRVAVNEASRPEDLVVPGHIFPLKARAGGVLQRAGHTEGSVDLARMAGLESAAVICEIMNDDGTMARVTDLQAFSEKHGVPIVTIADLVQFRLLKESLIEEVERRQVKTGHGTFEAVLVRGLVDGLTHMALIKGGPFDEDTVVDVRVHRQRALTDVFGHPLTGGRRRVEYGLEMLDVSNAAVFVYLTAEDTQSELMEEFLELADDSNGTDLASPHLPVSPMDPRMLGTGAQILRHLGVRKMRVHVTNPAPLKGLVGFDLEVAETHVIRKEP